MNKAFFNWSGGKDSAFALFQILNNTMFSVSYLLTTVNEEYRRISMHGVREDLLDIQTDSIGIPLKKIYMPEYTDMDDYKKILARELQVLKDEGIHHSIFGDIFLEDLRKYREDRLNQEGFYSHFPLWQKDTSKLLHQFIDSGFRTIVTSVDEQFLDKSFAGRIIDQEFIRDLPDNVDPCGENGEFHTFVFDGPLFKKPVLFRIGDVVYRKYDNGKEDSSKTGFWYCDLIPQ